MEQSKGEEVGAGEHVPGEHFLAKSLFCTVAVLLSSSAN